MAERGALALRRCDADEEWTAAVGASPQSSIFTDVRYLSSEHVSHHKWLLYEGVRAVAGALVMKPDDPSFCAPYSCSLYQGLLLSSDGSVIHRDVRQNIDRVTFVLDELSKQYSRLSFCLHPRFTDLRPIQWFNYHAPTQGQFSLQLAYTGIVPLASCLTFDDYVRSTRDVRQQEYRKAMRGGLQVREEDDVPEFERLYVATFARQGIALDGKSIEVATGLARRSLDHDFGRLTFCRDAAGVAHSATLFLYDERSAYYMFGATDPQYRTSGASTYLLYENMRHFFDRGVREIDTMGVNSPNRGDFKVSLNAAPTPYYVVTWDSRTGS